MLNRPLSLAFALALVLPSLAAAQVTSTETTRRVFTFVDDGLTVQVDVDTPGTLRMIRGQGGRLEVVARARDGFTAFGLSERSGDQLNLTAVGAQEVEFIVVVPDGARVMVRLPDRHLAEVFGTRDRSATWTWGNGR